MVSTWPSLNVVITAKLTPAPVLIFKLPAGTPVATRHTRGAGVSAATVIGVPGVSVETGVTDGVGRGVVRPAYGLHAARRSTISRIVASTRYLGGLLE